MSKIERIYRSERRVLIGIFVCSVIFFALVMIPVFGSILFPGNYKIFFEYWTMDLVNILRLMTLLIILGLVTRYLLLRIYAKKNPSFIRAVEDELIRTSWLKAYRFAFYLIIGIHGAYYIFGLYDFGLKYNFPLREWPSLAVGLPALFGAALYFSRESGHEGLP